MRIVTWNINGIRSMKTETRRTFLKEIQADIVCFQETKITSKYHHCYFQLYKNWSNPLKG